MNKWLCGIASAALALCTSGVASAQDNVGDFGFNQGDWELTLVGSGSNDSDFDAGGFSVNANVGYFIVDNLEIVVRQGFGYTDFGGDSDWIGATRVAIDYHFDLERFQPFIGASIGYLYGDRTVDTFAAGPEAGLKFFVNETTFIYGSVAYEFLFDDAGDADDNFDDGQFVYALGIGFKW